MVRVIINKKKKYKIICIFLFVLPVLFFSFQSAWAQAGAADRVTINADVLTYEENTGVISGVGNVTVRNQDVQLSAPLLQYDSEKQSVTAHSDMTGSIVMQRGTVKLTGESLKYNLTERKGYLTSASGKVDSFYIKGKNIEFFPLEEITKKNIKSPDQPEEDDVVAKWQQVYITTCDRLSNPHYRLQSREVVVIPGESVIIRNPRVYYGKKLLFTYPFDYVVKDRIRKLGSAKLFPRLGYDTSKGAGIGLSGPLVWDSGYIDVGATLWSKGIIEGEIMLNQSITSDLSLFIGTKHQYDEDSRETVWRPQWGVRYSNNGWNSTLVWSEREYMTIEKRTGYDRHYVVWKKPEWEIYTPWWVDSATQSYFRLYGALGKYEDTTQGSSPTVKRKAAGVEVYKQLPTVSQTWEPFYHINYKYYEYDVQDLDQQVLYGIIGTKWASWNFDMETAYLRRWVWGRSPMMWDSWGKEESLYHKIAYTFRTNKKDESWRISVRMGWDLVENDIGEMVYQLSYKQHCLTWEFIYRDQKRGNGDWLGLNLTINAYPENKVNISGKDLFDPFEVPSSLPGKK